MNIKSFDTNKFHKYLKFKNTALLYHGLGGSPSPMREKSLTKRGFNVINEHHDYVEEYNFDFGKSLFERELIKAEKSNLIIGISFGGYLAYHLAKATGTDCILINPALDRSISKTSLKKDFDIKYEKKVCSIDVYSGCFDRIVDYEKTLDYLIKWHPSANFTAIEAEHRIPIKTFSKIIKESRFIKNRIEV